MHISAPRVSDYQIPRAEERPETREHLKCHVARAAKQFRQNDAGKQYREEVGGAMQSFIKRKTTFMITNGSRYTKQEIGLTCR